MANLCGARGLYEWSGAGKEERSWGAVINVAGAVGP
jgi:hypothetical protein